MSFSWMFAIIVGSVILVIAIYAASSFVNTTRTASDTATAAQLSVILSPVETNLESGKYVQISFPSQTRIRNRCSTIGNFGEQGISTAVSSGIGEEFQSFGFETIFYNKYIFSSQIEQGDVLHVFVKPFEKPFKVADLIFVSTDSFCFVNPPLSIEDEVSDLSLPHVNISSSLIACPSLSTSVCFSSSTCDINVNALANSVTKNGKTVYYTDDSLLYAAIFSDPDLYECQVQRLMKRTGQLASLYSEKAEFLSAQGYNSGLSESLDNYASQTHINKSSSLGSIEIFSQNLEKQNNVLKNKIF